MPDKELLNFIKEARKRGFDDYQIKEPLLKNNWPIDQIEEAFASLKPKLKFKNKISIFLDSDILKIVEKRAKRNMMTISEQIEDIIRRSCVRQKLSSQLTQEKLDDMFIALFSRRKRK